VKPSRRGAIVASLFIGIALFGIRAGAQQSQVDTMRLVLVPPDSVHVARDGAVISIVWYPPANGRGQVTGSRDFTYWYCHGNPAVSRVSIDGVYTGTVDRTLLVQRESLGNLTIDTVGYEPSITMLAQIVDRKDTYYKRFNLGSNYTVPGDPTHRYVPGDRIHMTLIGQATGDTLDTGVDIAFGAGIIDSACGLPMFDVDLQTIDGFHIWRGLSPNPSQMEVIEELSRQNAFMGIEKDSLFFLEWPKRDSRGRWYYEWIDDNVFSGFTYYYHVTCFDRGYFMGKFQYNKRDNFICDEDLSHPVDPGNPVSCESVAHRITMTVNAQGIMRNIYAVPNPYRSGTSAETTPYYHNFPDGSIKLFNVPSRSDIKIFTISGDLVWEAHHESPDGSDGVVTWPVKNKHGQDVGSGVYVYRVKSPTGDMYGRIVIIR
jgi:hypothetical protein